MNHYIQKLIQELIPRKFVEEAKLLLQIVVAIVVICGLSVPLQIYLGHVDIALTVTGYLVVATVSFELVRRGYVLAAKLNFFCLGGLLLGFNYIIAPIDYGLDVLFPVFFVVSMFIFDQSSARIQHGALIFSVLLVLSVILGKGMIGGLSSNESLALLLQRALISAFANIFMFLIISKYFKGANDVTSTLRRAMTQFEMVGRTIDECFFIFDIKSQQYTFMSDAYSDVFGRSPLAGRDGWFDYLSCISKDDAPIVAEAFKAGQSKNKVEFSYRYISGPNDIRTIKTVLTYLGDRENNVPVWVGVHRDITSEVNAKAEEEAQRVQSIQASKLSLLGEMAGGVAHEINNPLAVIDGNVEVLRIKLNTDDATVARSLDKINLMVTRIAKIVRGLLIFSGQTDESHRESCQIQNVIEGALDFYQERAARAGIKMAICVPPESPVVYGNPAQLSQVILHLLTNALDAVSSLDERWVRIDVKKVGGVLEVRVTDSGKGIPEKIAEKVMQPFFTTKEIGKGTGLGLSVSRGIVVSHGGQLEIDRSSLNTCFVMTLPLHAQVEAA